MTDRQTTADCRYQTLTDFLEDIERPSVNHVNNAMRISFIGTSGEYGSGGWLGASCYSGADVIRLVRDGWKNGHEQVKKSQSEIERLELNPLDRRRRLKRVDFGDHLDIHAVYAGRLDTAWTQARRKVSFGRQNVSVCVNSIVSGGENADVLYWRGAAGVMLSDLLEEFGYSTRIVVGFGGKLCSGSGEFSCRITVKDFGAPLDLATASAILLPGFFRALGHGWMAALDVKPCGCGMSIPGKCVVEENEFFASHEIRDEKTAKEWATQAIRQINAGSRDELEEAV